MGSPSIRPVRPFRTVIPYSVHILLIDPRFIKEMHYREICVGDGGPVDEEGVDDGGEPCPGGQVQRRGALLVGRVARRLVRQQQLHDVPE